MILILSTPRDDHAQTVLAELLKLDPKRIMEGYMKNMALGEKGG